MNRLTAAIAKRGERRISATRAHVERCGQEVRAEISRLYDRVRELEADKRLLLALMDHTPDNATNHQGDSPCE